MGWRFPPAYGEKGAIGGGKTRLALGRLPARGGGLCAPPATAAIIPRPWRSLSARS